MVEVVDNETYRVQFTDYGNEEEVNIERIVTSLEPLVGQMVDVGVNLQLLSCFWEFSNFPFPVGWQLTQYILHDISTAYDIWCLEYFNGDICLIHICVIVGQFGQSILDNTSSNLQYAQAPFTFRSRLQNVDISLTIQSRGPCV